MTFILWSSDFVLYLEEYLMYEQIISQYDLTLDLKINVGHYDLYFMAQ